PGNVEKPADAKPFVPAGFQVQAFADGFSSPRVIAIAPNGDVFVADSGAGEVYAFRMAPDGSIARKELFADGFDQPYGLAFYPPGPDPSFVYVANTGSVVRFPYKAGDPKATGGPQTIVPKLPTGHHWTRDLVFSRDGKTMFVAVGSGSNLGDGTMGK